MWARGRAAAGVVLKTHASSLRRRQTDAAALRVVCREEPRFGTVTGAASAVQINMYPQRRAYIEAPITREGGRVESSLLRLARCLLVFQGQENGVAIYRPYL